MRIIALAALTLLLTGCVPADPVVTLVPVPSTTPLFASDADALKAAEDAYAAYLKVSDQILADGGADPGRIDAVATPSVAKDEKKGYAIFQQDGYKQVGLTTFDSASLQQYIAASPNGKGIVTIYVCANVAGVNVFGPSGQSVVSPSRPDRTPFEVSFDVAANSHSLLISEKDVWEGKSFC